MADSKVPVLTEVVAEGRSPRPVVDAAALEALARELERAVLARLAPEVERVIEETLARTLPGTVGGAALASEQIGRQSERDEKCNRVGARGSEIADVDGCGPGTEFSPTQQVEAEMDPLD